MKYERKFKCKIDGWLSSTFGDRGNINKKLLPIAQEEACKHSSQHFSVVFVKNGEI